MSVKMFDDIDKKILYSLSREEGKTKYQVSKDTQIPYQKINYRMDVLTEYLYITKQQETNGNNNKKEVFFLSERVFKLEKKNLIVVVEQSNLFIGSLNNETFSNVSVKADKGKLILDSDYY